MKTSASTRRIVRQWVPTLRAAAINTFVPTYGQAALVMSRNDLNTLRVLMDRELARRCR